MALEQGAKWWQFESEPAGLRNWIEANYTYASRDLRQDNVFVTNQRGFKTTPQEEANISPLRGTSYSIQFSGANAYDAGLVAPNSNGMEYTI